MIAAVEHRHKVVWGVGPDQQAAYNDAVSELKSKTPGMEWGKLEYCHLADDADLSGDGEWLYQFVVGETENQTNQIGLF